MIDILLFSLKLIGILVLAVILLVLLVVALVLFVPIVYRVRVIHNPQKTQVNGRVSFLFPLLVARFFYGDEQFTFRLKLFWHTLLGDGKKEKKPRKPKKKKEIREEEITEIPPEEEVTTEPALIPENTYETDASEEPKKKEGFFQKIRSKIVKLRETVKKGYKKIKKLLHQKDEITRLLDKPETKEVLRFVWEYLKKTLRHILPRKIKGYLIYGSDDPATTGKVLGAIAMFYAVTGPVLKIQPDFEQKRLECDLEFCGRVQVFTILVILGKLYFNKELKQLLQEVKNIKEVE